jgi:hypothetical protein
MSTQSKDNISVVSLSGVSHAFYLAGGAKGRLECLRGSQDQLERAAAHYKAQVDSILGEGADPIDITALVEFLKQIVDSFGTIPKQIANEIPKAEQEYKELESKAISLESTRSNRIHRRLSNAIDGFIEGWNR